MDTQNIADNTTVAIPAQDGKTIHPIPLKDLHVSPLNMRAEKKEPNLKRMAVIACSRAFGSARPISSTANRVRRRAMKRGSSPPASMRASQ